MMRPLLLIACLVAAPSALMVAAPATARDAFAKYYRDYPPQPIPTLREAGEPELLATSRNLDRDIAQMWAKGYRAIGYSFFTAERQDPKDALKQAESIHARYVILCQSCAPATDDPIRHSGRSGGFGQEALFFAPLAKIGSGLLVRETTAAERGDLGKNGAVTVVAVRNGSPASAAGLVAGDKMLSVDDMRPVAPEVWNRLFLVGDAPIRISFVRDGVRYDVTMTIPPEWRPGEPPKGARR